MHRRPFLDLNQVEWSHTYGDLTLFGTWVGDQQTPALVLVPTHNLGGDSRIIPCVVPLDSAWLWAEETGDPRHVAWATWTFANNLGLEASNAFTCMRIASAIRGNLGRLLAIRPKSTERVVVADAVITDESGRQRHAEIADHV